jgi:hypothetical protein
VTKLQSLADRPATKKDIGKKIYWHDSKEIKEEIITKVDDKDIWTNRAGYSVNTKYLFWQPFSLVPNAEYNSMRDLLDRAKGLIKNTQSYCTEAHVCSLDECYGCQFDVRDNYNRGFPNCTYEEQREQWLKDLAEVCG